MSNVVSFVFSLLVLWPMALWPSPHETSAMTAIARIGAPINTIGLIWACYRWRQRSKVAE